VINNKIQNNLNTNNNVNTPHIKGKHSPFSEPSYVFLYWKILSKKSPKLGSVFSNLAAVSTIIY
jgi:hypothetical protein